MKARLGRRGTFLLLLAVIDVAYGYSLIGPSAEASTSSAVIWRQHFAPTLVWGGGWLLVGAILIVSAFMQHDAFGYATAIGWKILWSLMALLSWAFGDVDRGWVLAVIFGVFGGMVAVVSGWSEPVTSHIRLDEDDE